MMLRNLGTAAVLFVAAPLAHAAPKYSVKVAEGTAPPQQASEGVRKLLSDRAVQVLDDKGEVVAELWFRKELPVRASEAAIKSGISYRQVPETSLVGVMRLTRQSSDYRKQKIPAGVYTLRLGFQPMDGDHMGTAPYGEFCLISPAADDKEPAPMPAKKLQEQSAKATGGHPGVFLLFPGREASDEPKIVSKSGGHVVLFFKEDVVSGSNKGSLGFGLTLVGHSPSA